MWRVGSKLANLGELPENDALERAVARRRRAGHGTASPVLLTSSHGFSRARARNNPRLAPDLARGAVEQLRTWRRAIAVATVAIDYDKNPTAGNLLQEKTR